MAEPAPPDPAWVAGALGRELGVFASVVHVQRRTNSDLYRADWEGPPLLVKVGPRADMAHEASALRRASTLVDGLAPQVIGYAEPPGPLALLAMEFLPARQIWRGGLNASVWTCMVRGLLRLHSQGSGTLPRCFPSAQDFINVEIGETTRISLSQLRELLVAEASKLPARQTPALLRLYDELVDDIRTRPGMFEQSPRYVHGDIWSENVLTDGSRCWIVDWSWLHESDYALELARVKLMLDELWPPWKVQRGFEWLLHVYARRFGDESLVARLRVYLPLVSLANLVQFGHTEPHDPLARRAMLLCLTKAQRDRALWSRRGALRRMLYALTHPSPNVYSYEPFLRRVRRTARRAPWILATAAGLRSRGGSTAAEPADPHALLS